MGNGNVLGNSYEVVKNLIENEAFTKDKILSVISRDYSPLPPRLLSSVKPGVSFGLPSTPQVSPQVSFGLPSTVKPLLDVKPKTSNNYRKRRIDIFKNYGSPMLTRKKKKNSQIFSPQVKTNKRVKLEEIMDEDT